MAIQLLSSGSYMGAAPNAVVSDGISAHTHIAILDLSQDDGATQCFIKFYPDKDENGLEHHGLINELIGHIVAEECGACVPDAAGLLYIPLNMLPSIPEWEVQSDPSKSILGWWSKDMSYPSLKAHYKVPSDIFTSAQYKSLEKAINELVKAPDTPQIIALDFIIANTDRNIGNLLRKDGKQYVLIDHGRCLTGSSWNAASLDPIPIYKNVVLTAVGSKCGEYQFKSAMVESHRCISDSLDSAICQLEPWLEKALDSTEIEAINSFIRVRGDNSSFARHMGLVG